MAKLEVYILFLEFMDRHQNEGLRLLNGMVDRVFPGRSKKVLVIDNAIAEDVEYEIDPHTDLIGGDNSEREFSGWEKGLKWVKTAHNPGPHTVFVLANDTFHRSYGQEYMKMFCREPIKAALNQNMFVGYADAYPQEVDLFGLALQRWIRTSLFILNLRTLERLLPLSIPYPDEVIFSPDRKEFFRDSAPLSKNYQQYLKTWLFGESIEGSPFKEAWHSQGQLTEESFPRFKAKARCVLSEHYLSARARRLGIALYDVREPAFSVLGRSCLGNSGKDKLGLTRKRPEPEKPAQARPVGEWIVRGVPEVEARRYLAESVPWRVLLKFDSGPRSDEFETFEPFNRHPLRKLLVTLNRLPPLPANAAVLDIGFNRGYNALHMAQEHGATVTGIDVLERHKRAAEALFALTGAQAEFLLESAEDFERPEAYDLILHFGTLYHLANPLRSLMAAGRSLKPGGWLALETIRYAGDDPAICKWIHGFGGDRSCFWALGELAIREALGLAGFEEPELIEDVALKVYEGEMTRATWIARKRCEIENHVVSMRDQYTRMQSAWRPRRDWVEKDTDLSGRTQKGERVVIIHNHLFKNAGSTIDWALRKNFCDGFVDHRDDDEMRKGASYLGPYLIKNTHVRALSTHHLTLPLPVLPHMKILVIMMFRHPIERVTSVYHFEKTQTPATTPGAIHTKSLELGEYVRWRMMRPDVGETIRNFHMHWSLPRCRPRRELFTSADFTEAQRFVSSVALLGLVERFDESMILFEEKLKQYFPSIDLSYVLQNVGENADVSREKRIARLRSEIGEETFSLLVQKNEWDIKLYEYAVREFERRLDAVPDLERKLRDFRERKKRAAAVKPLASGEGTRV